MDKKPGNQGEAGSITLIAIIVMVAFGILLAGLLPFITHTGVSAAYSVRSLQAHYAAEGGAKRAIVGLAQGSDSWGWLGNEVNLTDSMGTDIQYQVNIIPSLTGVPADGTYTVTSVGTCGRSARTVKVQVTITRGIGMFPDIMADLLIGGDIINQTSSNLEMGSSGNIAIAGKKDSDIILKNDLAKNFSTQIFTIPTIDFTKAMSGATALPLPSASNRTVNLQTEKVYSHNGTLNFDNKYKNCGYNANGNGYAIVVIDGDLNWNTTGNNMNGNILFLVNGNIHINTSVSFASCCFYCNNLYIGASGGNFGVKLMVRNNIYLSTSLNNVSNIKAFSKLAKDLSVFLPTQGTNKYTISNWSDGN
jgi:hypothetical protein